MTELTELIPAVAAGVLLIPCTISDIRRQRISWVSALGGMAGGLVWAVLQVVEERQAWGDLLISAAPGVLLTGLAVLTEGKIGLGDGVVVLSLGLLLGCRNALIVVLCGLLLSAVWSAGLLIRKKAGKESRIPMMPFLLAGFLIWGMVKLWRP